MNLTRIFFTAVLASAAGCASTGHDLNASPGAAAGGSAAAGASVESADAELFRHIVQANLAEVAMGKLAVKASSSPAVRGFAQRMIDDHGRMHAEGAAIAKAKGIAVPAEPDARHRAATKELEQLSGERFDIAYMEEMVKGHVEALQLLERAYAEIGEQDLRAHAQQGIPLVRQHLDQARRIAGELVG